MLALGFQLQNPSGRVPGRVKVVWGGGGGRDLCRVFFVLCFSSLEMGNCVLPYSTGRASASTGPAHCLLLLGHLLTGEVSSGFFSCYFAL